MRLAITTTLEELAHIWIEFFNVSSYWLLGQEAAGILCVCLPTYKPLFPKKSRIATSIRGGYASLIAKISTSSRNGVSTNMGGCSNDQNTLVNETPGNDQQSTPRYNLEKPLPPLPLFTSISLTTSDDSKGVGRQR